MQTELEDKDNQEFKISRKESEQIFFIFFYFLELEVVSSCSCLCLCHQSSFDHNIGN